MSAARSRSQVRVGILVDQLATEYTETLLSELFAAAREEGVAAVCLVGGKLAPSDLRPTRHVVFDLATRASVDALLVSPLGGDVSTSELVSFCRRYGSLPICSIAVPWAAHSSVVVDNDAGLREALGHLIEVHRRRRIAFIRGPELNAEAQRRYQVYVEALGRSGIAVNPSLVAQGTFEYDGGIRATGGLLDARRGAFDAVVAANDASALGAIDELKRRRVAVPDEVAVVGFDDLRMSRYVDPALTTVRQPVREQARRALRTVLAEVRGDIEPSQHIFPSALIVRESCGCPGYVHPGTYAGDAASNAGSLDALARSMDDAAAWMRAIRIFGVPETNWPERLCAAFLDDLAGHTPGFLGEVGALIAATAKAEGDVGEFQRVVTALVDAAQRHLGGDLFRRADMLLHAARVKVSVVAGRVPTRRRLAVERATLTLLQTSADLTAATDVHALRQRLASRLAPTAIDSFYVCRYEDGGGPDLRAKVVAAHDRARPSVAPAAEGREFLADGLLPSDLLDVAPLANALVCALDFGDGGRGYVLFEGWTGHGLLYEGLTEQIGSVLGRVALLERLLAEAGSRRLAEAKRLEDEMGIAAQIQAANLPDDPKVDGLEVATAMRAATEVAGDYYDVVPTEKGCWIGIGDVSGHGLPAGLATLMLHGVVRGVARRHPDVAPHDLFAVVNAVLYENIRSRMGQAQHVTLTLLRYERSGRLSCAGAHEVILVFRAADDRVDVIETPGTWIGLVPDVRGLTEDITFELREGDIMVLFTDGISEARSAKGEPFGVERLIAEIGRVRHEPVALIRDAVLAAVTAWAPVRDDDMSIVIARQRKGVSWRSRSPS